MNLHTRKQMPEGDPPPGGGGGAPPPPWFDDTNKDYVSNKGWKSPNDVITSNRNLETLLGADKAGRGVIWPKDENDKDGWKAINAKLGVPEKPEDYGLTKAEADADDNLVKFASGAFHARGIPKAAAAGLLEDMRKYGAQLRTDADTAAKTKGDADLAALNTEWGTAAAANTESAKRFAKELGISQEQMTAVENALGTATFMKMFYAGGKKLGEHGGGGNPNPGGNAGVTQEQARTQLDEARTKRAEGKMSEKDWLEIMERLSPIANPEAKAA